MSGRKVGDGTGGGPSAPAPPGSGLQTPISQLLSPSILSMYGGTLVSYTIWDHCVEELNARKDGGNPATSVEDLLCAFQPLLAENVIWQIRSTLEALKDSTLGVEAALVPSKESILQNVLNTLQERAYAPVYASDANYDQGWQVVPTRSTRALNQSRGIRRSGRRTQATLLRGRGRGTRQRRDDDSDGDDDDVRAEGITNGQYFRTVEQITMNLNEYTTPPKGTEEQIRVRKLSIAERARLFSRHFEVRSGHVIYSPYDIVGSAFLYHGLRVSTAHGFSRCGVQPIKSNTEFSPSPAFYVTNDVAAAFEFPLHNHLAKDPGDTIAVFEFKLDLQVLHGDIPPPSGEPRFKVRWFERGVHDEAWRKFCTRNMYGEKPKLQHGYDIVIGAMCFPNAQLQTVSPRPANLLQVAFCSKAAWKWVGSCVKRMYVENRGTL